MYNGVPSCILKLSFWAYRKTLQFVYCNKQRSEKKDKYKFRKQGLCERPERRVASLRLHNWLFLCCTFRLTADVTFLIKTVAYMQTPLVLGLYSLVETI